jgi:hypothetical protein
MRISIDFKVTDEEADLLRKYIQEKGIKLGPYIKAKLLREARDAVGIKSINRFTKEERIEFERNLEKLEDADIGSLPRLPPEPAFEESKWDSNDFSGGR